MQVVQIENRKFRAYPIDKHYCLYVSNEDPFNVIFFLHNSKNEEGYGGSIFEFKTSNDERKAVKGPWSSRPSVVKDVTGLDVEEYLDEDGLLKFRLAGLVPCKSHEPKAQRYWPVGEANCTGFCAKCGKAISAIYDAEGNYARPIEAR